MDMILAGNTFIPSDVLSSPKNSPFKNCSTTSKLTEIEQMVLEQIGEGHSNKEIALIIGTSSGTVKAHVHRILKKLGVNNRVKAAKMVAMSKT